ncbi:MAG: class I tRNA ligase family protein, partial [Akkermansia sp.]
EEGEFGAEWGEVVELAEENWYFNLSQHAAWLKGFVEQSPDVVTPAFRKVELLQAIERAFDNDLCISRPKERLSWGIPLPFDENFVTYVWFDALINYISFAGYLAEEGSDLPEFNKLWPAACEVIGKDILVPAHGVYWLAMLHAMGFEDAQMPKLLVHGWLNINGEKMSKTLGNIVDPMDLCEAFGADPLRYYLVRDTRTGYDSDFDFDRLKMLYNTELGNDLGNLLNRSINMCVRYNEGRVTIVEGDDELSANLRESLATSTARFGECMNAYNPSEALAALNAHVTACNAYIEQTKPWVLVKEEGAMPQLQRVLQHLVESCAHVGFLLGCVIPDSSAKILEQVQLDMSGKFVQDLHWGLLPDGHLLQDPSPVFPRILSAEEKKKMAEKAAKAAEKAARKAAKAAEQA